MKFRFRKKGPLIYATIVAIACCFTAGVSTFAWFQAEAHARAKTSSGESASITVNKPDSFAFYSYRGNVDEDGEWDNKGVSFSSDFVAVTSADLLQQHTQFNNFLPGQNFVYCVRVLNAQSLSISISKIISNDAVKQGLLHTRLTNPGSNNVNIGWAIDVFEYEKSVERNTYPESGDYAGILTTLTATEDYADRFNFDEANDGILRTGSPSNQIISLDEEHTIGIYDNANNALNFGKTSAALDADKDIFVFFSIVFSDDSSTYYKEVKSDADDTEVIVSPIDADQYYKKDASGNSNCYSGLKFALNQIDISIG